MSGGKMFGFQIKRFLKEPICCIIIIIAIIIPVYIMKACFEKEVYIQDYLIYSFSTIELLFVLFMILSYHFSSELSRTGIRELARGSAIALFKYHFSTFIIIVFWAATITVCMYIGAFNVVKKCIIEDRDVWIKLLINNYLYQFFLPLLFSIVLGIAISIIKERKIAYIVIAISYTVFSTFFVTILGDFTWYNKYLKTLFSFFSILTKQYNNMLDGYYMYSSEAFNYERIIMWIVLTLGICFATFCNKKINYLSVGFIGCAIILAVLYSRPYSYYFYDGCLPDREESQLYYQHKEMGKLLGRDKAKKEARFKVESISGVIDIDRQLTADIKVRLKKHTAKDYPFTLSHMYKVKEVKADGMNVRFEQKGDNIYISHHKSGTTEFEFKYEGYSLQYYSNSQATYLPGYFAYVPFPGFKELWMTYESAPTTKSGLKLLGREDNYEGIGYKVNYDLQINCDKIVFSNLKNNGNNRFVGKSEGVTLVASDFAHEANTGSNRFIFSSQFGGDLNLEKMIDMYGEEVKNLKCRNRLKGKTIIFTPRTERGFFFTDEYVLLPENEYDYYEEYLRDNHYPEVTVEDYEE